MFECLTSSGFCFLVSVPLFLFPIDPAPRPFLLCRVLINLVPEFLAVLQANDRLAAYHRYLKAHGPVLTAYWQNYVLDLDSPQAESIIERVLSADRTDLIAILDGTDLPAMAEDTIARAEDLLGIDRPSDTYLMVGVGGANAGELVVAGRGIAFVCLEHFTGRANPETYGGTLRRSRGEVRG